MNSCRCSAERIVVTRAREQAAELTAPLTALGAEVMEFPTIEIQPAAHYGPLDDAIARLATYDWLIFTSVNGVSRFLERLDASKSDLRQIRAKICAIGPATKTAIEALHLKVDAMGKEYVAEGLLEALAGYPLEGSRILLPRAAVARDLIPLELARRGAHIDVVDAYRTVMPANAAERAREIFGAARRPDCVTLTSSSTARNLVEAAGIDSVRGVPAISIGPVTTRTARELGIEVAAEARMFTLDGLVEAIPGLFAGISGTPI